MREIMENGNNLASGPSVNFGYLEACYVYWNVLLDLNVRYGEPTILSYGHTNFACIGI
jgi:hypothetical protein